MTAANRGAAALPREPGALRLPSGQYVLPGNRWDLLADIDPPRLPAVTVVIPYFEAQDRLDLLLCALSLQRYPPDLIEVVVADDGSATPPRLDQLIGPRGRTVRQENEGFRAAAARNLGAGHAGGEVLVFLDADTFPEPDYLRHIVRLPALTPDAIVTGRRRHADLSGWTPSMLRAWWLDKAAAPAELTEPSWLRDEHARSGDLLTSGLDAYRFAISAVLACSRRLFEEVGGFDETLTGYGGEDWELTHRCLCAGAVLAHVPQAVAWHDGADWAERGTPGSRRRDKAVEAAAMAARIPEPYRRDRAPVDSTSGTGLLAGLNLVAEVDTGHPQVAQTIQSILGAPTSCRIWLTGANAAQAHTAQPDTAQPDTAQPDARIHVGPPPPAAIRSARVLLRTTGHVELNLGDWTWLLAEVMERGTGRVTVRTVDGVIEATATRAQARAQRWQTFWPGTDLVDRLFGSKTVDQPSSAVSASSAVSRS